MARGSPSPRKAGGHIRIEEAGDIYAAAPKSPSFLVESFIPKVSLNILAGSPESGKSTALRTLAVALAQGKPDWLGFKLGYKYQDIPASVLLWHLEESENEVRRHLVELGLDGTESLVLVSLESGDTPTMCLDMACKTYKPDLVVIDTFGEFCGVKSINDYGETQERLQELRQIVNENETCIILTHHTPKVATTTENAVLGSTAIRAGVDSAFLLRALPRTRTRIMEPSKVRIGTRFEPIAVGVGDRRNSILLGSAELAQAEDTCSLIAEILAMESRALTKNELISATGLPPAQVWQALGRNPGNKIKKIVSSTKVQYVLANPEEQDRGENWVPF